MSVFNTVLALDTAMAGCSVAVYDRASGKGATRQVAMVRGQAEQLMKLVEEVMAEAGVSYEALDAVITTRGPGAFTGLRIGVSAAKSLALALDIPLYSVSSLQALALCFQARNDKNAPFASIIETKRSDYYFQRFDSKGFPQSEPSALSVEEVDEELEGGRFVCIGDARERFQSETSLSDCEYRDGHELSDMAICIQAFLSEEMRERVFTEGVEPLYLRAPDVSVSKKPQRVLEKL